MVISININDLENLVELSNLNLGDNFFKLPIKINECNILREVDAIKKEQLVVRYELGNIIGSCYKCYYNYYNDCANSKPNIIIFNNHDLVPMDS